MEAEMDEFKSNDDQHDSERDIQQPPPALEHANATVNNTTRADCCQQKKRNWPQYVEAACAVLLVIITGTYTYYAAGQLHKMKRSTEAAEKAANAATSAAHTADETLREIRAGGADTHELAVQAKTQSANTEKLAEATRILAQNAQRAFISTRPYIVIEHTYVTVNNQGMSYVIWMINKSSVTATSFVGACEVFLDGRNIPTQMDLAPERPVTFAAEAHFTLCTANITNKYSIPLNQGRSVLQIYIHGSYSGPAGNYPYCTKLQYIRTLQTFANKGDCDVSQPFPQ